MMKTTLKKNNKPTLVDVALLKFPGRYINYFENENMWKLVILLYDYWYIAII